MSACITEIEITFWISYYNNGGDVNVVTTLQGKQWDTTFIIKSLNNQKVEVSSTALPAD